MVHSQHIAFGPIVKERRRALDLTQAELARRVACATITIRKIEADDARPSQQIAERLAMALNVPLNERAAFVQLARAAFLADQSPLPPPSSPTPTPQEIGQEDLSGRAIRGYELGERLGAGSFGAVYRAVQPLLEREVAVKIILPQYADHPEFIRRFEAEAQLVARLEHPYIVPLYDYWREPGVAYLVMRFLRGGSLRDRLESGPLDLPTAGRLLEQVGAALHAAHRVGVVHRDLKPANVLLDEEGNGYLADFGIAKNLSDPQMADATQAGAILGSPAYASPEQILSEPVQPQADIYALGILLYELLAGELPFHGPTPMDYIRQHLEESPPPLAAYPALDSVVRRATARQPGERYPDIPALVADFRQAIGPSVGALAPIPHAIEVGPVALENPYKGLRPFAEADAADFFGRETLVQELLGALGEAQDEAAGPRQELARFLAVVGPSGCGKSSAIRAGLLPALRRGGLVGSEQWFIVDLQPGTHPWEELEAALLRIAVNPPESLLAQLQEGPRGLLRAVRRVLPADPAVELLLVIDQFEELFTQVVDEEVRAAFLAGLVSAALDAHSRLRMVVTLRADFVGRALEYVDFGELLRQRTVYVLPLTPEELEQAIVGPAGRVGAAVEPELLAAVVQDVGDQPGMLPLLQYALTELFERRQGRAMTLAAYRESGGVAGALGRRAEELYAQLDDAGKEAARQLFLRLVTLGEGSGDTRRRVLQAEVVGLAGVEGAQEAGSRMQETRNTQHEARGPLPLLPSSPLAKVLDLYGKHRFLTFDHDPLTRGPTVEVAHEALLREWGRLRGWLESSRADVRLERLLGAAAAEWENVGREPSYLLQGARLAQFEGWAAGSTLALTAGEREYLLASVTERGKAEAAEQARREHELQTARQLAATERERAEEQSKRAEAEEQRAEEQGRNARRLRQRALWLGAALVVAAVLAALALFFGQAANRNLNAAQTAQALAQAEADVRATAQAVAETQQAIAVAEAGVRATAEAVALTEADARATAEAEALASLNRSEALRLAAESNRLRLKDSYPELIALLALQSLRLEYTPQGDEALESAALLAYPRQILTSDPVDTFENVAISPDGRYAAAGGYSGQVYLWDLASGAQVRQFTGHTAGIIAVRFSPDSRYMVSAGFDNTARLWDVESGQEVRAFASEGHAVANVAFSPDGHYIATCHDDGTAWIWEAGTGEQVHAFAGHTGWVDGAAFSPDGRFLATTDDVGTIRLWDIASGQEAKALTGHTGLVMNVVFSPDGRSLFTGGSDKTIRQWDIESGAEVQRFDQEVINGLAVSPDGRFLFSSTCMGRFSYLWEIETGIQVRKFIHPAQACGAAFTPDGQAMATASHDGTVRLWEVAPQGGLPRFPTQPDFVFDVAFSPDGRTLATAGYSDMAVRLWDTRTGALLHLFQHNSAVFNAAYSPDGHTLATLATPVMTDTAKVRLWDTATWIEVRSIPIPATNTTAGLAFSPDGQSLAVASYQGFAGVWDATSGEQRFYVELPQASGDVAFSPDGTKLLAGCYDGKARLWDLTTEELLYEFVPGQGSGDTEGLAFSPDGRYLTTGGSDGMLRMYDVATGAEVRAFVGHSDLPYRVAFSPDGRYIVSSSYDNTARLWDAVTGQELRRFAGHSDVVFGAAYAPDGNTIATASWDKTFRLWYTDINDTIDVLCGQLLRDLTPEERAQYGVGEEATCPLQLDR